MNGTRNEEEIELNGQKEKDKEKEKNTKWTLRLKTRFGIQEILNNSTNFRISNNFTCYANLLC
jgi:hypothetical protein